MNLRRGVFLIAIPVVLAALAACSGTDPLTNPVSGDLVSKMGDVAVETDSLTDEIVSAEWGSMIASSSTSRTPVVMERSFNGSKPCPAGGMLEISGMIRVTFDPDTGVLEIEASGERTRTDCAFIVNDVVITVNGSAMWDKFRRRVNGFPDGPQTSNYSGSWMAVSSTGEERSCDFAVSVLRDPMGKRLTVEGALCGEMFRRHRHWSGG